MKKHIVCLGDSNTHGYCADPKDCADGGNRFNENERWPRVLEKLAQKAKYSQYTLTAEELEQLQNFINAAQATLKSRPWYWQLLLRFVYAIY